jgi:peptide deformylase
VSRFYNAALFGYNLAGGIMAVLPIRTLPEPVLRQKAKRVRTVDASIKKLIADMLETMHADEGRVGLAAPQVGVSLRVVVIGLPGEKDIILVNPEIVRRKGERLVSEGCLSIPGYVGELRRAESVTAKD